MLRLFPIARIRSQAVALWIFRIFLRIVACPIFRFFGFFFGFFGLLLVTFLDFLDFSLDFSDCCLSRFLDFSDFSLGLFGLFGLLLVPFLDFFDFFRVFELAKVVIINLLRNVNYNPSVRLV